MDRRSTVIIRNHIVFSGFLPFGLPSCLFAGWTDYCDFDFLACDHETDFCLAIWIVELFPY